MAKREEIPTTDSEQIEQLIERLQQGKLEQSDTRLLERLLRTFLSLLSLLQQKNASIKKLKRMIFGPRSEKRKASSHQTGGALPMAPRPARQRFQRISHPPQRAVKAQPRRHRIKSRRSPGMGARKPPTTPEPKSSACITPLSSQAINARWVAAGGCTS